MTTESEIEREAVVRWLREVESWRPLLYRMARKEAAHAIERGDHLKERG